MTFKTNKPALLLSAALFTQITPALALDTDKAEKLFSENCAVCHGMDRGGYIGPALNSSKYANFSAIALEGIIGAGVAGKLMPAWAGRLKKEEIKQIAELITTQPKRQVKWDISDVKKSLQVYMKDEAKLPNKPQFEIKKMNDLMAVMGRGKYSAGENSKVVFFNGANHNVVGEIPVDRAPHIIDYHPTNERWAYIKTDGGRVYKVDLYTMQATRSVQVGFTGPSLAVSANGKYIAAGSFVPNTATILDAETLEPVKFFNLKGVDPDGKMVESDSGSITATPYGNYFSIALEQSGQVWIVDLNTPDLAVTKIKNVGRHLHDSFLTSDGKTLIIAAYDDNKMVAIDFESKKIVKDIPAGCVPHTGSGAIVRVDGREIGFGTNFGSGPSCDKTVVTAFDAKTFEVIKQIPTAGGTESPAAHPNSPYVVVDIISDLDDTIQFIDKKSLEVVKTMKIGGHSHFPEFTDDGNFIYVSAGYQGNEVVILDAKTLEIVKRVPVEVPAGIFSHNRPKITTVGLNF